MGKTEMTKQDELEIAELSRRSLERYREALGDMKLTALAASVEAQVVSAAIDTSELLGKLVGTTDADRVVLAALREAAHSFEAGMKFADRKTKS